MDKIESLSNTLSQITMYDIKSMYNQAKNIVLNVSEMEAKVREATNDDPWGASSTLMQEIAQGTFNFHQFNEIMPSIYSRFMEKEARQWRQIYKALQLLEYLIKHGSERVIDDARAHISTIKMLRNFHYIDEKGKDEGVNVRNRARELVELLSDVEKIRAERRKAKSNKHKYVGTGNDGFGPSFLSGGSRYGGFGSDNSDYHHSGVGSSSGGSFRDDTRRGGFEEYNAGDDEVIPRSISGRSQGSARASTSNKATPPVPTSVPTPAPVVDLLGGFDDDNTFNGNATTDMAAISSTNKALPTVSAKQSLELDDDDFADFQAAPVQASTSASTIAAAPAKTSLVDLLGSTSVQPTSHSTTFAQPSAHRQQPSLSGASKAGAALPLSTTMHRSSTSISSASSPLTNQVQQSQTGHLFGGVPLSNTAPIRPMSVTTTSKPTTKQSTTSSGTSNFDDLWSMSLGGVSKPATANPGVKSIKDLEKERAQASLWGSQTHPKAPARNINTFGTFGSASSGAGAAAGGDADDLLL
ncbi:hypothetical protein AX17_006274 [Amanita inopinata Kibby_2008]|nr:hypothetical protein AX17_006274 [Amanita inopinata Kibby_2008]